MITSTETPEARFVAVINQHVVLADISNSGGSITGYSDMVWWSAVDDATSFTPSTTTQSDYQRLRDVPGQIMGLVGGVDYGYVFKRNGIYKMSYVGAPLTFTFQNIALGIGCASPRSIVVADGAIYFWSGSGIYRLRDDRVEHIGRGKVDKMLRDFDFEDRALARPQITDQRTMDAVMVGADDSRSELVLWAYRGKFDSANANRRMLIYNPASDEWGYAVPFSTPASSPDADLNIAALCSINNPISDETAMLSGVGGMHWTGSTSVFFKFRSPETHAMTLTTKVITTSAMVGDEYDGDVRLLAVRPMFRGQPTSSTNPRVTIDIDASDDPLMISNVRDADLTQANANADGWYPVKPIGGEFWRFQVSVPSMSSATVKDFLGLQLKFEAEGERG
jgi:hypothetical protein